VISLLALVGAAFGQEPTCRALAREKNLSGAALSSFVATCERLLAEGDRCAKSRNSSRPSMSPADEERLDRAMTRNLLQSIEEELRRNHRN
jgi:hypothetical protein